MDIEADAKYGGNCSVLVRRMLDKTLDQDLLADVRDILRGLDTKALGNGVLEAVTEELSKKGRFKEIA